MAKSFRSAGVAIVAAWVAPSGRGVRGLWVFGSVARARVSLVGLASLRAELSDLAERGALRPAAAREAAERDAVRAL